MYQKELNLLGYTEKWLQSGILQPDRLVEQVNELQSLDGDPYTEHYRFWTLYDFISYKDQWADQEISDFLQLAYEDEDKTMACSAVLALLQCRSLTDKQFETLPFHPVVRLFDTSKTYWQQKLLRTIDREGVKPSVIEECLDKGDDKVHRRLLEFQLERETLVRLATAGATKAVRNMAKQRLQQRQHREK